MGIDCESCSRSFVNLHAAHQHMNAIGHWACETCDYEFWTEDAAAKHMDFVGHWRQYECEACDTAYRTPQEARRHMELNNHFREYYCESCERGFQNENNLRIHLNSNIHRGSNISCPFCKRNFATATGVTHHLESGSCPNARTLNRDIIFREIRKRDPGHLITKKLLTWNRESSSSITVTERCWNGSCYECYLCHREFGSLNALNQHVNSPAHKQKIYHCPGRGCGKEFVSLAALFNHLESETCGAVKFEAVQRNVGGFLTGRQRLIGFV
ncbi:hypothetical protein K469DRAFT_732670 [Zopfia rhizophila CBS 207.26]|uniref:C2H2-type domain-containing protein n=1 Tax=Zopfia rhizophila CBS 207.26 TaxID=1314779 RepID=A0A6A6EKE4_9PEZI|nr:hypothetical protein K469DRAFT_732670 [Zopfia rhizophila CBS 207.26]